MLLGCIKNSGAVQRRRIWWLSHSVLVGLLVVRFISASTQSEMSSGRGQNDDTIYSHVLKVIHAREQLGSTNEGRLKENQEFFKFQVCYYLDEVRFIINGWAGATVGNGQRHSKMMVSWELS